MIVIRIDEKTLLVAVFVVPCRMLVVIVAVRGGQDFSRNIESFKNLTTSSMDQ